MKKLNSVFYFDSYVGAELELIWKGLGTAVVLFGGARYFLPADHVNRELNRTFIRK